MAARAAGERVSPRASSPASSAASYAVGSSGVSSTRVGSGSRSRSTTRLLWFACHPTARRRSRRRHRLAPSALRRSSAVRPVHGRVSPNPSRIALPLRLPQCGCRTVEVRAYPRQRVFPRISGGRTFRGKPRAASTGPGGPAHRSSERAPDDVDDLVDVLVGLALLRGGPHATADVVLEDHDRQRIDGGPQRSGLLQDVDAVFLALYHPGDSTDLALHPRQAPDQLGLVLRVA